MGEMPVTIHILLVFLLFAGLIFYLAVRRAPDRPTTILNEKGLPRTYPEPDDQSTQSQSRRGKVE